MGCTSRQFSSFHLQACFSQGVLHPPTADRQAPPLSAGQRPATGTVWCKRDSGIWGPNYANVIGNLTGAANVHYPQSARTVGSTIGRGFSVTAQGIIGSEVIEFWPDIVRDHQQKQAEKLARQGIVPSTVPPPPR